MERTRSAIFAALLVIAATTAGAQAALTLRLSTTVSRADGTASPGAYTEAALQG